MELASFSSKMESPFKDYQIFRTGAATIIFLATVSWQFAREPKSNVQKNSGFDNTTQLRKLALAVCYCSFGWARVMGRVFSPESVCNLGTAQNLLSVRRCGIMCLHCRFWLLRTLLRTGKASTIPYHCTGCQDFHYNFACCSSLIPWSSLRVYWEVWYPSA